MEETINRLKSEKKDMIEFLMSAISVTVALFMFFASAAYIVYKVVSNRQYKERWKDYDECGLS